MNQDTPWSEPEANPQSAWWDQTESPDAAMPAATEPPNLRERTLGTLAHLCALLNLLVPILGAILALLEIQAQGRESAFVKAHAQEALAFQLFYFVILVSIATVLVGQIYCMPLAPLLIIFGLYCNLAGAASAWRGRQYHYPLTSMLVELWNDRGATVR